MTTTEPRDIGEVEVEPGSALAALLDEARERPLRLHANGAAYRLTREAGTERRTSS